MNRNGRLPQRRGRDAGHSLVEVSIIVAVLGVLAVLAFPTFRGIVPRVRLDNAAEVLRKEIELMRGQSIAKSASFRVVFDVAGESYTLLFWDESAAVWRNMGANRLAGMEIESVSGFFFDQNADGDLCDPGDQVDFLEARAQGGMNVPLADCTGSANVGYVTLRTPADFSPVAKKRIRVEQLGRVSVQSWQGGSFWTEE